MRKLLISLLLASAAVSPAFAAPDDPSDREQAREERAKARAERREAREEARSKSSAAVEVRVRQDDGPAPAEAVARAGRRDLEAIQEAREARRDAADSVREWRAGGRQELREQRREAIQQNRALRQSERPIPPVLRNRVPVVSSVPREGTQPPLRAEGRRPSTSWSTSHWRRDRRYDWWNWRNRNRSLFRLGFYFDPFGWGYRPYSIGWRMWPSYYSERYWLNDPWMYRLPYAPPGYRWIRYYNDAVLVDTWDGHVVDVIYNFFW